MGREISGTKEWSVESVNCVTGCSHDCRYCYARFDAVERYKRVKKAADWPNMVVRERDVQKKRKKAKGTVMFPTTHDITPEVLEPCMRVIRRILDAGNRILIVTKPHLHCIRVMCDNLSAFTDHILFRFTIGAIQDSILKYWEPGAPPFPERYRSLLHAYAAGFTTSVSSEPLLDWGHVDILGELVLPYITDAWWIGKMNLIRQRVKMVDARDMEMVLELERDQEDEAVRRLYERYKDNQKVKWKESIKKVIGLDLAQRAGEDV